MKFNIILPFFNPTSSIGGVKIMYEIANRLSVSHDVTIYHCLDTPLLNYPKNRPFFVRKLISLFRDKNKANPKWFKLNDNIKSLFIDNLKPGSIRDADYILYTWYSLSFKLADLPSQKGKKFYFVQGYEIWAGNEDLVHQSYNLPQIKYLCISDFLFNKVGSYNKNKENVLRFNLAIDESKFTVLKRVEDRNPFSICMLYSEEDHVKGSNIAIEALNNVKNVYPELSVTFFSVYQRSPRIPAYIDFKKSPDNLPEVYNSNAIFISPSYTEGWALPPAEAMMCGCALICTDIPGHQSYAFSENSIKFTAGDVKGLTEAIVLLIENQSLRMELAQNGIQLMKKFTWKATMEHFYTILDEK